MDDPGPGGAHLDLGLHGLEHHQGVAGLDPLPGLDLDPPHAGGEGGLDERGPGRQVRPVDRATGRRGVVARVELACGGPRLALGSEGRLLPAEGNAAFKAWITNPTKVPY